RRSEPGRGVVSVFCVILIEANLFASPVCRERPTRFRARRMRDRSFRNSGYAAQQTIAPHKLSLTLALSRQTGEGIGRRPKLDRDVLTSAAAEPAASCRWP